MIAFYNVNLMIILAFIVFLNFVLILSLILF